jgi:hypothetical protein
VSAARAAAGHLTLHSSLVAGARARADQGGFAPNFTPSDPGESGLVRDPSVPTYGESGGAPPYP